MRLYQIRETWKNNETYFDKSKSGYYRPARANNPSAVGAAAEGESAKGEEHEFDWKTAVIVLITQGMTPISSMMVVGQAFKLAFLAQINQGCITVMFGMGSILMAIVFYFGFGQTISYIKMFGMLLMLGAGAFLSLDEKSASEDSELTAEEMSRYGYYAVGVACCAPLLWTLQAYFYVKLLSGGRFKPMDLAFDGNIITYTIGSLLHLIYLFGHDYDLASLGLGSIIGVLQVGGMILMLTSYTTGPAGAVQAMVNMQTVWQTLFDALFLGQLVS